MLEKCKGIYTLLPMSFINKLSIRLQNHPKRVVFAEGADVRILAAARQFATRKLGAPILLGSKAEITALANENNIKLDGIAIIDPKTSDDLPALIQVYESLRRFKNLGVGDTQEIVSTPTYFATLMLATSRADALVAGATSASSSALRPILQILPMQKNVKNVSSMMILDTSNVNIGEDGMIFMSDCGVIPEPNENQLCDISYTTANLAKHITNITPRVAMISYSSKTQSSKNASVNKMKALVGLLRDRARHENLDIEVDGELQLDAALSERVAKAKGIVSSVAGKANVLIFPDLNSGNAALKMAQMMSDKISSYGQILTGLSRPAAEISRGSTVDDIYGTAVIVAAQAVDRRYLYGEE